MREHSVWFHWGCDLDCEEVGTQYGLLVYHGQRGPVIETRRFVLEKGGNSR
jgi:hypothetical protein